MTDLLATFRQGSGRWTIVPVVGQRSDPEDVIGNGVLAAVGHDIARQPNERFAAWIGRIAQASATTAVTLR